MKTKNILSKILIFSGVLFVAYSVILFVQNQKIELNAKNYSENAVEEIIYAIENDYNEELEQEFVAYDNEFSYEDLSEEITSVDESYIGILYFPSLDLELAVQSGWDYDKLANSPCVYGEEPFSIAGHNYTAHFGKISNLEIGDLVIFTDTSGDEYVFEVVLSTIVNETEIEQLQDTTYDLTLFTCNYYNDSERVLIRLNLLEE